MTHSLTVTRGGTSDPYTRTLRWDGGQYVPAPLRADTSGVRTFKGWADPSQEGITPTSGDLWERTGGTPVNMIIDTDASTDVDDVFDVKAAVVYHNEGVANLLGIAVTTSNAYAPGACRAIGDYYGYSVPVASYAPIGTFDPFVVAPAVYQGIYNNFSHTGIGLASTCTDSTTAIRTWLAASTGNVAYVMTGFAKGFRAFLESASDGIYAGTGSALASAKIARVYAVAGLYPNDGGSPEFNLVQNASDWNWLNANCPVPITWVGIELGNAVGTVGGTYLSSRLGTGDVVRSALSTWGNTSRTPWGVLGVHYAAEGADRYRFNATAGTNAINSSTGSNTFTAGAGTQEYLTTSLSTQLKAHHNSLVAAKGVTGTKTWSGSAWA